LHDTKGSLIHGYHGAVTTAVLAAAASFGETYEALLAVDEKTSVAGKPREPCPIGSQEALLGQRQRDLRPRNAPPRSLPPQSVHQADELGLIFSA